jgi:hypothetical protein
MTARLTGEYETQDGHRCARWRVDGGVAWSAMTAA